VVGVIAGRHEARDLARRGGRHEHAAGLRGRLGRFEGGDVTAHGRGVLQGDRAVVAGGVDLVARCAVEVGELVAVQVEAGDVLHLAVETAQAVLDVGRVGRLAVLAVTHDVEAHVDLAPHYLFSGRDNARVQRVLVGRFAFVPGHHQVVQVGRPGQTAGVGGEN